MEDMGVDQRPIDHNTNTHNYTHYTISITYPMSIPLCCLVISAAHCSGHWSEVLLGVIDCLFIKYPKALDNTRTQKDQSATTIQLKSRNTIKINFITAAIMAAMSNVTAHP